ncbi:MAG: four helix bundle protein [Bacteroidales bacterium]|nr:four helix bundle protein [Bacteroidales bacterium]
MTTKQILELEDRNLHFNHINLVKEGMFWRAYERSAYLFVKHFWHDITVNGGHVKAVQRDVHYVGFPERSLQKIIDKMPEVGNSRIAQRSETQILIADVPPIAGFDEWKKGLNLLRQQASDQMQPYYGKLPLYKAVYDFYFQAASLVRNFPRDAQHTLGEPIIKHGLELNIVLYRLIKSQKDGFENQVLISTSHADEIIENLRFLFRITYDMKLFNTDRYVSISESFESIRKQLHGWRKRVISD